MCGNTTKHRIGAALRQLMAEQPFEKITVQNLMDATNMKRQSFYYHFRDTRDVLLWICRQELAEPLLRSELEFADWLIQALEIVEQDRSFYRKLLSAIHPDFIQELGRQILWQRVTTMLYGNISYHQLDANQLFVSEFFVQALLEQFLRFASGRVPLQREVTRDRISALLNIVRLNR